MSETRKPSITDTISPLQAQAWTTEHEVVGLERSSPLKESYLTAAKALRLQDINNKIQELFAVSDAQNALLDGIAQAKENGHEIPIITMEPGVDYSLMMQ